MYIHVRARPGAKKEMVVKKSPDHYIISVREKAERGQANDRIIEVLRTTFGTKKVRLVNGAQSPSKLFSVGD